MTHSETRTEVGNEESEFIDTVAEFLDNVRMRKNRVIERVLYRDASLSQVVEI